MHSTFRRLQAHQIALPCLARCSVPPPQMDFKKFQLQFGKRLTHVADLEATFANMDVDGDGTLNPREQSAITKLLHASKEL